MSVHARVGLASPGDLSEPQLDPATSSLQTGAEGGREQPGALGSRTGGDATHTPSLDATKEGCINAMGGLGKQELGGVLELGTIFSQSWRKHETPLKSCTRGTVGRGSGPSRRADFHTPVGSRREEGSGVLPASTAAAGPSRSPLGCAKSSCSLLEAHLQPAAPADES